MLLDSVSKCCHLTLSTCVRVTVVVLFSLSLSLSLSLSVCGLKHPSLISVEITASTCISSATSNSISVYNCCCSFRTIYEKLGGAVPEEQRALYSQRVEEMVPSIRYCAYNIGDMPSDLSQLMKLRTSTVPGSDILASKIDVSGGRRIVRSTSQCLSLSLPLTHTRIQQLIILYM